MLFHFVIVAVSIESLLSDKSADSPSSHDPIAGGENIANIRNITNFSLNTSCRVQRYYRGRSCRDRSWLLQQLLRRPELCSVLSEVGMLCLLMIILSDDV